MITEVTKAKISRMHAALAHNETLLIGHYSGSSDCTFAKVGTGYHPGFEIFTFAHADKHEQLEMLILKCERIPVEIEA